MKIKIFSYGVAFKMITRRQGGSDEGILNSMLKELTTKPTLVMFEGDFVSTISWATLLQLSFCI